jgi:DNA-binding Lrp family transcriptional regulator
MQLTAFDRALLNIIQTGLPIARRPFAIVADQLGVAESDVIERLEYLKKHDFIRRIGAFFDSEKMGYVGTLAAVKVAGDHIAAVAQAINAYPGVTHNYERTGEYNLWFTLMAPDLKSQQSILDEIAGLPDVVKLINLPAVKKFKISVQFNL